jgi:hypothetical protein
MFLFPAESVVKFLLFSKERNEIGLTVCCNKDKHSNDDSVYGFALE